MLSIRNVSKRFQRASGQIVPAIDDVSLDVRAGEFLVLLGPSGCGKTTLLRAMAGLEQPDEGEIAIDGRLVFSASANLPPEHRGVGFVFQSYALWPHMTVSKNVAYPLRCRRVKAKEARARAREALGLVGIEDVAEQYPNELSGGQQQRVALARALVAKNDLILFDEPLSNVDAKVREQLRYELLSIQHQLGFAAVYVTHDQVEAMELGHRIAVLREGVIAQIGTAAEIYEQPASAYVARFVGKTNEVGGSITALGDGGRVAMETPLGVIHGVLRDGTAAIGDRTVAIFRPESCRLSRSATSENRWPVTVREAIYAGSYVETVVEAVDLLFRSWDRSEPAGPGEPTNLVVDPEHVLVFRAGADGGEAARNGESPDTVG